jgi:hypothetical protein
LILIQSIMHRVVAYPVVRLMNLKGEWEETCRYWVFHTNKTHTIFRLYKDNTEFASIVSQSLHWFKSIKRLTLSTESVDIAVSPSNIRGPENRCGINVSESDGHAACGHATWPNTHTHTWWNQFNQNDIEKLDREQDSLGTLRVVDVTQYPTLCIFPYRRTGENIVEDNLAQDKISFSIS